MDILQVIIQGGAVGLCAYLIYVLQKITGNHINHNNDALNRLEVAITKLTEFLEIKLK